MITGDGWIIKDGKQQYSDSVAFVLKKKAKNEQGFDDILADVFVKRTSEISEGYMRFKRSKNHPEYGDCGHYEMCDKERGAGLYMYAEYKIED